MKPYTIKKSDLRSSPVCNAMFGLMIIVFFGYPTVMSTVEFASYITSFIHDSTPFTNENALSILATLGILGVVWLLTAIMVYVGSRFIERGTRIENMLIDNQKLIAIEKKK